MKNTKMSQQTKFQRTALCFGNFLSALVLMTTGCTKTSIEVGGSASTSVSLSVTKLNDVVRASWKVDGSNNVYENVAANTFEGTCSRGIKEVYVYIDTVLDGVTAPCDGLGKFSWAHTFASGATYALAFRPVLENGDIIAAAEATENFVVDTVAPSAPVIVSPASSPYIASSANVTISGTVLAGDGVDRMTCSDTGTFTFNSGASTFNLNAAALVDGESRTVTFTSTDFAGNTSSAATMQISYLSSMELTMSGVSSAYQNGTLTGGGTRSLKASDISSNFDGSKTPVYDGTGTYDLYLGQPNNEANQ